MHMFIVTMPSKNLRQCQGFLYPEGTITTIAICYYYINPLILYRILCFLGVPSVGDAGGMTVEVAVSL